MPYAGEQGIGHVRATMQARRRQRTCERSGTRCNRRRKYYRCSVREDADAALSVHRLDREGEHVTRAALGLDVARFCNIDLELAPQSHDLRVDRAVVHVV